MREIKFRAWVVDKYMEDGNTPKTFSMISWFNEFFSDMSPVTGWSSDFPELNDPCVTLMQYTGLHDKNGKEIYEGDIVRKENPGYWKEIEPNEDDLRLWSGGTGQVMGGPFTWIKEISCGEWCFNGPEGREWSERELEVIGNIYETPDLL